MLRFIAIIFIFCIKVRSQELPKEKYLLEYYKILFDKNNLSYYSSFGGPSFFQLEKKENDTHVKSSKFHSAFYYHISNNEKSLSYFGRYRFKTNFYIFLSPFLGQNVDEKFNVFSTQDCGLGFENNWVRLQIGRGSENWGAGEDIALALSNFSPSYDYLLVASNYGQVRVKYLYGYLETIDLDVKRYITARGMEWTNKKSIIIGLSEIVVYSGKNRNFEFSYLNPMNSHLEIELNDRLTFKGTSSANAVWQIHTDFFFKSLRFSHNKLYDEFALDLSDSGHRQANSSKISYTTNSLIIYASHIQFDSATLRHTTGSNNFVIENRPLGWIGGSDSETAVIGITALRNDKLLNFSINHYKTGKENITLNPYNDWNEASKEQSHQSIKQKKIKMKILLNLPLYQNINFKTQIEFSEAVNSFRMELYINN